MALDKLFLLRGDFFDKGEGPFYCPDCALLHGVLQFYPQLLTSLEVHYVDFPRPRLDVVRELGLENQGCPVLILASPKPEATEGLQLGDYKGRQFLTGAPQ